MRWTVAAPMTALSMMLTPPATAQAPQDTALKGELVALEKNIWKAWASMDEDYYFARMTPDVTVVIIGQGRLAGRDTVIEEIAASPCKMNDFALAREELRMLAPGVALLSYEATQDASCAGHKLPTHLLVSSIYVRGDDGWKLSAYQETPIEEP